MSDLISRKVAFEVLTDYYHHKTEVQHDALKEALSRVPSAEPERMTGKWEAQPSTGEDRPFIWWKCSECGHIIFSETERDRKEFHAFCGRCGARLE